MLTAQQVIELLHLQPLTIEGGFFRETYRSSLAVSQNALPGEFGGPRNACTCIYYLLTPETFSAIHRVKSDEIFHFYAGDPVEMLQLRAEGECEVTVIGNDLTQKQQPQVIVPAGIWQGCRLIEGGHWALMGCTVAPGFDYSDFELALRADMLAAYKNEKFSVLSTKYAELIVALTDS